MIMASTIVGGILLQFPTGWLSDVFDRRLIIVVVGFLAAILATLVVLFGGISLPVLLGLLVLYGGASTSIYPMCLAHAADNLAENDDVVGMSAGLLRSYGMGSAVGPLLAGWFFPFFDGRGLFVFTGIATLLVALLGILEFTLKSTAPLRSQGAFAVFPRFTPEAFRLRPPDTGAGRQPQPQPKKKQTRSTQMTSVDR
jgi:MFS family permease